MQWNTADVHRRQPCVPRCDGERLQREPLDSAFVGEKVYLRLIAPGLDRGPERDITEVTLKGTSGATTSYQTPGNRSAHPGFSRASSPSAMPMSILPAKLPPVALNGFPVRYGDDVISPSAYDGLSRTRSRSTRARTESSSRSASASPATKWRCAPASPWPSVTSNWPRNTARWSRKASRAARSAQARKLLAEALATHRDEELKAHAEYLLGNLAQEYADLSKNEEAKLPMYQDALARFSKIPSDYPDTEFASKAQFKTALVYEKMGEIENSVEEYVKLAYKYPDDELIPTVMSRLGGYFQTKGMAFKKQADPFREKEDAESQGRGAATRRAQLSRVPQRRDGLRQACRNASRMIPLAGLAGLRAAQNFMRAHQYDKAIAAFSRVIDNEDYDGADIRSQAIYWSGLSHERIAGGLEKPWPDHAGRPTSSTAASPSISLTASGPSMPAAASPTRLSRRSSNLKTRSARR